MIDDNKKNELQEEKVEEIRKNNLEENVEEVKKNNPEEKAVEGSQGNNKEEAEKDAAGKKPVTKKIAAFVIDGLKTVLLLGACAGLGIYLAVGNRAGSPEKYAENYFKYYASNNYSKMYEMVSCKEDHFINEEYFEYKYESEKHPGGIKKYKFSKGKTEGKNISYKVTYTTGGGIEDSMSIVLKKQAKKVYGFFPTWKVDIENEIAHDCSVGVTEGLKGYFDHVSLEDCKNGTSEDGTMHYYFIDRIFKGDHVLFLNQDNLTSYTFSENISDSGEQMIVNSSMLELPEDDKKEMYDYSKLLLSSMYGYAMDGVTSYDDIAYMFYNDEQTQERCRNCFDTLRADTVHEDGSLMKQININNVSVALSDYKYPSDALVSVAYTYSYIARTGRTSISGITQEYDGMGTAMALIRYKFIDGAWKVTDIMMPCADYSQK